MKDESFDDFQDFLTVEAIDYLAACYKLDLVNDYDNAMLFLSETVLYKLLFLIEDIAYFKFKLNKKHYCEDNKLISIEDIIERRNRRSRSYIATHK